MVTIKIEDWVELWCVIKIEDWVELWCVIKIEDWVELWLQLKLRIGLSFGVHVHWSGVYPDTSLF